MSTLRAFVSAVLILSDGDDPYVHVDAFVYQDEAVITLPGVEDPHQFSADATLSSDDTIATIKDKVQTAFADAVNLALDRDDGDTIEMVYLEGTGI